MTTPRIDHTATALPDGTVLVAGGSNAHLCFSPALSSAEIYHPASGDWTPTGSMTTARQSATATLLKTGKVLVAGGGDAYCASTLASAELYDPASGTWAPTQGMPSVHAYAAAALLPSGKVLVAGGNDAQAVSASADLYDPVSGAWTSTGSMATPRSWGTLTLLQNGKVLAAGGFPNGQPTASAELYDPASGAWTSTGSMTAARGLHSATLLNDGRVLVVGGAQNSNFDTSAEVYDPRSGTWSQTGSLMTASDAENATLLGKGGVLVSGGYKPHTSDFEAGAEIFNPTAGTWASAGSMTIGRVRFTSTLLATGQVLVAGGDDSSSRPTSSAELFSPALPPLVSVTGHPPGFSSDPRPEFRFASDSRMSSWCRYDQGGFGQCSSPYRVGWALVDGPHTFEVYAVDAFGQASATASYSWVVDTVAPSVAIASDVGPAQGASTGETAAVFFYSASERLDGAWGAHYSCSLDGAPFAVCANATHYTGLGLGSHTFAVRGTDNAGNTGAAARRSWTVVAPTVDEDRDGYTARLDCNDSNPAVHPGAIDIPGDGIDQDCDGADKKSTRLHRRAVDVAITGPRTLRALTTSGHGRIALSSVRIQCPAASRGLCSATVDITTENKVRVGSRRGPVRKLRLALAHLRLRPGSRTAITVKLSSNALAALRRLRHVKVTITITARRAFGHPKRRILTTTLKAPHAHKRATASARN